MVSHKIKLLAFYLPQYHPIPENDEWWGKGFTEWTNVLKAKPLFRDHHQPNLPGELGFYDLRVPEVREAQAELAKTHGIDGFCYWHYWFGNGKQLLERPFHEVLKSGKPDFPFCLAWANQSWTGIWHGLKDQILIEQIYPGDADYIAHFYHVLPAFQDKRYIKINNKPLFVVYIPDRLPNPLSFTSLWNELAIKNGFAGMYFIGIHQLYWDHKQDGFDEKTIQQPGQIIDVFKAERSPQSLPLLSRLMKKKGPEVFNYKELVDTYDFRKFADQDFIPTILPNWDNTPRSKYAGWVFQGSTPELFKRHLENGIDYVINKQSGEKIIFIKSWNEWAEGNYLEPDARWGRSYLDAVKQVKNKYISKKSL
jgi:hypothetical protein